MMTPAELANYKKAQVFFKKDPNQKKREDARGWSLRRTPVWRRNQAPEGGEPPLGGGGPEGGGGGGGARKKSA